MLISQLYNKLNSLIPPELSEKWDNDGLMVCVEDAEITRVVLALDVTSSVVDEAIKRRANLIISHHPLFFHPPESITYRDAVGKIVTKLIRQNISVVSLHTRFDKFAGGVCDIFIKTILGDVETEPFADGLARICNLDMTVLELSALAGEKTNAKCVNTVKFGEKAGLTVFCPGSIPKEVYSAAVLHGANTIVTGETGYNRFVLASDEISLIGVGHYESEAPAMAYFEDILSKNNIKYINYNSNPEVA
jgi:dinuclear metal center YbgI/SA1388 family protein